MSRKQISLKTEAARCLLCKDAPCTKACPNGRTPDRMIRSVNFRNMSGAARLAHDYDLCGGCAHPCMEACSRKKIDRPIDIPGMVHTIRRSFEAVPEGKADLSVEFCGVHCENPFFLSSSVVGSNYEMVARAYKAGWGGVCFKTIGLFVPEEVSPRFSALDKEAVPFVGFKNIEQISDHTIDENIGFIRDLKRDFPEKVIIASIMGQNEEEWTTLARLMEEAGADIIECNFSCPQMVGEGLGSDVGTNPDLVRRYTAAVKKGTSLPVLAKMTPNITDMTVPARAAAEAGADGIAAINTIKSIMNVAPDTYGTAPDVSGYSAVGGYSGKAVKPIALRFIHDMKKDPMLASLPISGMGGIENWRDALEFIALGCETVQVTTAVMQYGYRIIEDLIAGLSDYMASRGIRHLSELVGRSLATLVSADDLDRKTIEYPAFNREECIGCGRCVISCDDGGHQALEFTENGPVMKPAKCVGCQLCVLVCPVGAIRSGTRTEKR